MFASKLENTVSKSENDSAPQSNSPHPIIPHSSSGTTQDSEQSCTTPSATSSPNATQLGQVDSHGSCMESNPSIVGPQNPKLEEGSDATTPGAAPLSKHTKIVNAIMKIKQELQKCLDSGSSTNSSTPSTSGTACTQESGNQGAKGSNTQHQGNNNLPPVNIGECLMCGGDCGCDEADSEEEEEKCFLPPPPMSSVEVDSLFGKLKEQDKETPAEPASVINTKMYLHQKQALNWMINKENCNDLGPFWRENGPGEWFNEGTKTFTNERPTCIKGGILADDMGLGKTLTVIALIFTNHLDGKPMFMKKENNSKKRKASHIVTPDATEPQIKKPSLGSVSHDEKEVVIIKKEGIKEERKKERKAVAIKKRKEELMNRKRLLEDKRKKDPGALFRQIFLPKILKKKEKQEYKVKKEKADSSPVQKPISIDISKPSTSKIFPAITKIDDDDDYDDDSCDDIIATDKTTAVPIKTNKLLIANPVPNGAAKATLIICPLSVLSNWTDQICSHVHPSVQLKVYMYYGAQRIQDLKYLSGQDIVLTTYPTLANDFRSKLSPLHKIKWLRIILDEGHMIRNKRTTLSKAVLVLEGERRWAITGTPIQNRIDDLKTIILYLRLEPFNDSQWWRMSIENLRNKKTTSDLADFRLNTLIKHVSIRRLKDEKVDNSKLVELPPKQVVIQDIELSDEERKLYDMMQLDGQSIIRRYIRHDSVLRHYGHCFAILMRLRQMCLHPRLCKAALKELQHALDRSKQDNVAADANDDDDIDDSRARLVKVLMEAIASGDSEECAICLESLNDPVITPCAHVFCCGCITDVLNSDGLAPKCPMCRAPVDEIDLLRVPEEQRNNNETAIDVDEEEKFEDSAKIKALISSLEAIRDKDPSTKSVVVSQFTSFLNIIEEYLDKHGFGYLRLDGKMGLEERLKALEDFNEPGTATVFLLSMSAGGTGINLTAASRVFLMDPAWNPAVEEQCFDRCHRMGQTEEVIITKYVVMDSVEERMLTLQEQKRQLMSQAFGAKAQSEEDRSRARVRDIAHLIGLRPARQGPNGGAQ